MDALWFEIEYPINAPHKFQITSNIRRETIPDYIYDYIRDTADTGADPTPANQQDIYKIRYEINLDYDNIKLSSNCGNLGLMSGILMDVAGRLKCQLTIYNNAAT